MSDARWEAYFYPETLDPATGRGTLRNRYGERDRDVLRVREYAAVEDRARELRVNPGRLGTDRDFSAEHLKAIHGYLFQDVYEWAGQFRNVDMLKGDSEFASPVEIPKALAGVERIVTGTDWPSFSRQEFVEEMSRTYAVLCHAHPFRDGNGRAGKLFLHDVAALSPYHELHFDRVQASVWNEASAASSPQYPGGPLHPEELDLVFSLATVTPPRTSPRAQEARELTMMTRGNATGQATSIVARSPRNPGGMGKGIER